MPSFVSPRLIKIVVISDFLCPYTYIGHKEVFDAIAQCSDQPLTFEVEYRPFRLNASLPIDVPVERRPFFTAKFGAAPYEAAQAMFKSMTESLGLPYSQDGLVSQTTRAHRLSVKAYRQGGQALQQAVIQQYFTASCVEGKDIGNIELLADIAENAGVMSKTDAIAFLKSDELKDDVENSIHQSRASGIRGSPVTIIDNKFKLDGVQTVDTYVQVFRRLGKCAKAMAGSSCSDASSDGTVSPPLRPTAVAV